MAATMSTISKLSIITPTVLGGRELRAMRAPALLLIGDAEKLYKPEEAMLALAQRRMPSLEGAIVPDADPAMAQPDDVNERIVGFLQTGLCAGVHRAELRYG